MSSTTKPRGFYTSSFWNGYLTTQRNSLPVISDVDDGISDGIVRFLAGNPGKMQLQGTNTYLVGTGKTRILIDTGEGLPQWAVNVTRYLEDHDISISQVLLTHWHGDHTGGIADLLAYDPAILVYKNQPNQNQQNITNGQLFQTQGATIRAIPTPGHTADHTCFLLEEQNALFTGDNVLGHGYSVAECLGEYMASLRLMESLGCTVGYPGHGEVIRDLPRKMANYIAQRDSREQQIYAALAQQASSCGGSGSNRSSSSSSSGSDSDSGEGEEGSELGLSTSDIGLRLYGEVSKDTDTFESALKPLLNQVLFMLAENGKVSSKLMGPNKIRHWFARGARY